MTRRDRASVFGDASAQRLELVESTSGAAKDAEGDVGEDRDPMEGGETVRLEFPEEQRPMTSAEMHVSPEVVRIRRVVRRRRRGTDASGGFLPAVSKERVRDARQPRVETGGASRFDDSEVATGRAGHADPEGIEAGATEDRVGVPQRRRRLELEVAPTARLGGPLEAEVEPAHDGEAPATPAEESSDVVAGDVLDDAAAGAKGGAISAEGLDPEDLIAQEPPAPRGHRARVVEPAADRPGVRARDDRIRVALADEVLAVEGRENESFGREGRTDPIEWATGLDRESELLRVDLLDLIAAREREERAIHGDECAAPGPDGRERLGAAVRLANSRLDVPLGRCHDSDGLLRGVWVFAHSRFEPCRVVPTCTCALLQLERKVNHLPMLRQPSDPFSDPAWQRPSPRSRASVESRLFFSAGLLLVALGVSLLAIIYSQGGFRSASVVADRTPVPRGAYLPSELSTIDLFEQTSPSVVHITSIARGYAGPFARPQEVEIGTGSGFVWDEEGHIVTNFHVIQGALQRVKRGQQVAWITFGRDTTKRYKGLLIGTAAYKDLAVLRVEAPDELLSPIEVGTSEDLKVGQQVLAIGNPFGLDQTLTTGVISALGREIESVLRTTISDVIQTDAAINPGNSGGPLFDSAGRLIGVNTAIFSPSGAYAGIGFAIPVDTVRRVVPALVERGRLEAPVLGVRMNPQYDRRLGLTGGVMVWGVDRGSGAAEAGLIASRVKGEQLILGDVIVGIEDKPVNNAADLESLLQDFEAGDVVEVDLLRDVRAGRRGFEGRRQTVEVKLSSRE